MGSPSFRNTVHTHLTTMCIQMPRVILGVGHCGKPFGFSTSDHPGTWTRLLQ